MRYRILLSATAVCFVAASGYAKPKVDFWGYVSGSADAVLYVNTKQAEKAVDKKLYGQIKKDKHKAIDEMDEKSIFADKGRDLEGVANIYITNAGASTGLKIEGVARAYGGKKSIKKDIEELASDAKENGFGVSSQKAGKLTVSCFDIPAIGETPAMNGMVTPLDNEIFHYRFAVGSTNAPSHFCPKGDGLANPAIARISQSDASLAFVCDAQKVAGYITATNQNALVLKAILSMSKTASVICRAQSRVFKIAATFEFLTVETATAYAQMMQPMVAVLNQRMANDGLLSGFAVRMHKNNLTMSFDVGIDTAWKHIMQMTGSQSGNFGSEKRRSMKSKKSISK